MLPANNGIIEIVSGVTIESNLFPSTWVVKTLVEVTLDISVNAYIQGGDETLLEGGQTHYVRNGDTLTLLPASVESPYQYFTYQLDGEAGFIRIEGNNYTVSSDVTLFCVYLESSKAVK